MPHRPVIQFRSACQSDAAAIRDLTRTAYAKWVPLIGREPLPMTADYEQALREHQFDLLCLDGGIVALIETMLRPDHLFIQNVAVSPDHRSKGFGRQLLAHAERKAVTAGRTEIRLQTNAAFAANVALYTRLGYRIDRTEPFRGGTTVHMSKRLTPYQ